MTSRSFPTQLPHEEHQMWVRTRLQLEAALQEAMRQGVALITAGFGSFAIFDGLAGKDARDELPKAFALMVTAVGVLLIALAISHFRKMSAWVDADEFDGAPAPVLPDEQRPVHIAMAAAVLGVVSFVALLLLA